MVINNGSDTIMKPFIILKRNWNHPAILNPRFQLIISYFFKPDVQIEVILMENLICVWRMLRKQKNKAKQSKIKQKQKTLHIMKFRGREKKRKTLLNSGSAIWSFIHLFIFC